MNKHLDESIHLSDWDPSWAVHAALLMKDISRLVGENLPIVHIGSTAVRGMRAKPILDLMIGVPTKIALENCASALLRDGWEDMGEAGVPGRRYLRRRCAVLANIHVVEYHGQHWATNLAVRDFLRSHPKEAAAYAQQKQVAIDSGAVTLLEYSQRKSDYVASLVERAIGWRTRLNRAASSEHSPTDEAAPRPRGDEY